MRYSHIVLQSGVSTKHKVITDVSRFVLSRSLFRFLTLSLSLSGIYGIEHSLSLSLSLARSLSSFSRSFSSPVITQASGAAISVIGEDEGPAADGGGYRRGDGGERWQ